MQKKKGQQFKVFHNLEKTEKHAEVNKMKINYRKTKFDGLQTLESWGIFLPRFNVNNDELDVVEEIKLLGVIIRNYLSWEPNTDYIVKRANKNSGAWEGHRQNPRKGWKEGKGKGEMITKSRGLSVCHQGSSHLCWVLPFCYSLLLQYHVQISVSIHHHEPLDDCVSISRNNTASLKCDWVWLKRW